MIDYLKFTLTIPNFQSNKNLIYNSNTNSVHINSSQTKYKLPNKKGDHELSIAHYPGKGVVEVEGSIRKWHFGSTNMNDLTYSKLLRCFSLLANQLEVPLATLKQSSIIKNFEIGKNINAKVPVGKFFDSIQMFNNQKRSEYKYAGIAFHCNDMKLHFYDKLKELSSEGDHRINKRIVKQLNEAGNHFIRFETSKLRPKQLNKLGYSGSEIKSIADLIGNYKELILLWKSQFDKLITTGKKTDHHLFPFEKVNSVKDFKEFCFYVGVHEIGLRNTLKRLRKTKILAPNRSTLKKYIIGIDKKYSDRSEFDFVEAFRKEIKAVVKSQLLEIKASS